LEFVLHNGLDIEVYYLRPADLHYCYSSIICIAPNTVKVVALDCHLQRHCDKWRFKNQFKLYLAS